MKVLIMCGGKGTRLREETAVKPKPMVEIGGRPVLWHIMSIYARYGFKDFILPLGYKGEVIKQYFHDYTMRNTDFTVDLKSGDITSYPSTSEDWRVTLCDTGQETLKGARIKRVAKYIDTDQFMVTYGDGVADINLDGFEDVFVPQVYNLEYARALLFLNCNGEGFAEGASLAGIQQIDTYCGAWADVNGDGLQDLFTAGRTKVNATPAPALYINCGNDAIRQSTTWLQLTLRSTPSGGTAIGAVVRVTAAGLTQTQLNSAGISTYGQQNASALHFGFPKAIPEAEVTIHWPNGRVTRHRLPCAQRHTISADAP